jgi:hypothetical protein
MRLGTFAVIAVVILVAASGCGSAAGPTAQASTSPPVAAPAASIKMATPSPEIAAPCAPAARKFDAKKVELTGAWAGDDGGIYYLRQLGSVVWWNGMSSRADPPRALGREWHNVGRGEIKSDLTIAVDWADVPRGEILGHGTLTLKIGDDGTGNIRIDKTAETGTGFGNSKWTPCSPG